MAISRSTTTAALAAIGFAVAGATAALAQNYDGNHQVRFGAYLLGGSANGTAEFNDISTGNIFNPSYSNGVAGIGVSGGLEWVRRGSWSWGVEIDGAALQGSSVKDYTVVRRGIDTPAVSKIGFDYLATVRARGGLYLRNDFLWYGTLGVAFLGTEARTTIQGNALKVQSTQTGLAIGTGLEYDFGAGLLFGEYLYTGFGDTEAAVSGTHYNYDARLHTFRVGVKFKVGHDYYYDDVAARTGRVLK